ncbi:hypothetical protein B0T10DRAFT_532416 [Thelonectria olida]|uniref:Uncharacterized protein n=1 Tax=Thelonectria olida TaxID=1576542 RepID=A0A9P8VUB7_9HYPO|nr:hypothetical protein B0T10DRAFT_532416 [Thelonectria olida]
MTTPSPPFMIRVLEKESSNNNTENWLLPATSRVEDNVVVPQSDPEFLERELLVKRLNDVHHWLWMCGRPMPPRSLYHQRLLGREIVICENIELHLIWWRNRIFIKPMPSYLLDPDFWKAHIVNTADTRNQDPYLENIDACARGFLFSYTALIAYKSDFRIAQECGLLPDELTWDKWKTLAAQTLDNHRYDCVILGTGTIYCFGKGSIFRGYSRVASHALYGDLIYDSFSVLAGILAYVVIALTAMQVGLGVETLVKNEAFQNTSYGLTVFALIFPLIGGALIFLFVLMMLVSNWRATKAYEKRRFRNMQVEALRRYNWKMSMVKWH